MGHPVQGRYGPARTGPVQAKYGPALAVRCPYLPIRALTMPVHAPYGHVYGVQTRSKHKKVQTNAYLKGLAHADLVHTQKKLFFA